LGFLTFFFAPFVLIYEITHSLKMAVAYLFFSAVSFSLTEGLYYAQGIVHVLVLLAIRFRTGGIILLSLLGTLVHREAWLAIVATVFYRYFLMDRGKLCLKDFLTQD
jgi:hypothetical protein